MTYNIEKLKDTIKNCKKCILHTKRKQAVPGQIVPRSKLVVLGESPGKIEDEKGQPFVGDSGWILNGILKRNDINRKNISIINSVCCKPPGNRIVDYPDAKEKCKDYMIAWLKIIKPEFVITLGNVATTALTGSKQERGKLLMGNPLWDNPFYILPTFHPSYLLHNMEDKQTFKRLGTEMCNHIAVVANRVNLKRSWNGTKYFDKLPYNTSLVQIDKNLGMLPFFCNIEPEKHPYYELKIGLQYILQSGLTNRFEVYTVRNGFQPEFINDFVEAKRCWVLRNNI